MMPIMIDRARHHCFYCGRGRFLIRWTTVLPGGPSRWVCLWHTRRHLRG